MFTDFLGRELKPADWAIMYSTQDDVMVVVQIVFFNPATHRVTVDRQRSAGLFTKSRFSTPANRKKFYRLDEEPKV